MILAKVRVLLIFVGVVVLPLFMTILVDRCGRVVGAPGAVIEGAFIFFILWKMLVLPHDQLLVTSSANALRVFPGTIALWIAVVQWGGAALLVSWLTRRWSADGQAVASIIAIVVVLIAFRLVIRWQGWELEHMNL